MKSLMNACDRLYIKAKVAAAAAGAELRKMREEDEGLDVIITVVLLALGLAIVSILARYAQAIVDVADKKVKAITG